MHIYYVLASCSALAQNKYLARHNAALKVLFWEMLRELQLSDSVPPWYSSVVPKPKYESPEAQAIWNIPVFAVCEQVRQNRGDARFIDHEKKRVLAVEVSCPWTESREKKQEEKTTKYGPLRWELSQQFSRYQWHSAVQHHHRCPRRVVQRGRRGYERTIRGSRRRDSFSDAEISCHFAHPEHYQHIESDVLRTAEKGTETLLVIISNI